MKNMTMENAAWMRLLAMFPCLLLFLYDLNYMHAKAVAMETSFDYMLTVLMILTLSGGAGFSRYLYPPKKYGVVEDERDRVIAGVSRLWGFFTLIMLLALSAYGLSWSEYFDVMPFGILKQWFAIYLYALIAFALCVDAIVCIVMYRRDRRASA
jgi:hypothetical protein